MMVRVLLDSGEQIILRDLDPEQETIGDYRDGFRSEAASPGGTISFEQGPDRWLVIPVARVLAVQAAPDPDGEDSNQEGR